jgi:hypothetical protein
MRHLCEIAQDRIAVSIRVQVYNPKPFNPMINASDRLLSDITYAKSANHLADENLK